jgi:hypothetical protein
METCWKRLPETMRNSQSPEPAQEAESTARRNPLQQLAPALQAGGHRFDPGALHRLTMRKRPVSGPLVDRSCQRLVRLGGRLLPGWLLRERPMVKQRASTSGRIAKRS